MTIPRGLVLNMSECVAVNLQYANYITLHHFNIYMALVKASENML